MSAKRSTSFLYMSVRKMTRWGKGIARRCFVIILVALVAVPFSIIPVPHQTHTALALHSSTATPLTDFNTTFIGGQAKTMAVAADGVTYVGGDFTYVGQRLGHGTTYNTDTGASDAQMPLIDEFNVNSDILAVTPDGSGGWYVGGSFTAQSISNLIHITPGKVIDTNFNATPNGVIRTLAVYGSTLYVGGDFTSIGGQARNRIAALDTTTGAASAWNPGSDARVDKIILTADGATMYVGGNFTAIGGQSRGYIAALDTATNTNNATAWNPAANFSVRSLLLSGTTLYVAGGFNIIGGQTRFNIAALDTTINTNNATAWNPGANGFVLSLALLNTTLYAGGTFATIGGSSRNNLAALDTTINTNNATAWNPNVSFDVNAVALAGATLYAGGAFSTAGGQSRKNLVALDTTTNTNNATSWDPSPNNSVEALAISGTTLFVGGKFVGVNGGPRAGLVSFDPNTNDLTSWNPSPSGGTASINILQVSGSTLYVGGSFTTIAGQSRGNGASFSTTTGAITSWNPSANAYISDIEISGATIYVIGNFTSIGGQTRNKLAALDTSGVASSWDPNPSASPIDIFVSGSKLYVGGGFTTIAGQTRNKIASFTIADGNITSWDPNANGNVATIAVSGSSVFLGGYFSTVGGASRSYVAAVNDSTGLATSFNTNANNIVTTVAVSGTSLFVGGSFTTMGGSSRQSLAEIITTNGVTGSWDPSPQGGTITNVQVIGSTLYALGSYTSIGGQARRGFARYSLYPTVGFSGSTGAASESVTSVDIPIQLEQTAAQDVTVDYVVSGGTATGGGVDYTLNSGTVTIISGQTVGYVHVSVVNDAMYENDETVVVQLSNASSNAVLLNPVFTYTIQNDEAVPSIGFATSSSSGSESTATVHIPVTLSVASSSSISVSYAVTGGTATGTGTDYTLSSGTATIAAGQTSTSIDISVNNDSIHESNETIVITLSSPSNATLGAYTVHTYTIQDDDVLAVEFSSVSSSGGETYSPVTIPIRINGTSGQDVIVDYSVTGGAATGVGVDYSLPAGSVTIPAGQTTADISLTVTDDNIRETSETIVVTLSNPSGAILGSAITYTYTILDNASSGGGVASTFGNTWGFNGEVKTSVVGPDGTVYVGGSFTSASRAITKTSNFSVTDGSDIPGFPQTNGEINAIISDGASGWFVGGVFATIGGLFRNNLAHVNSDLTVDPSWSPDPDGAVYSLELHNGALYVGGVFGEIAGIYQPNIASLSASVGNLNDWRPNINGAVKTITVDNDGNVYIGGEFSASAQSATYGVPVTLSNGTPVANFPVVSGGPVYTTISDGNGGWFIGGDFTMVGSYERIRIAHINSDYTVDENWLQEINGAVYALRLDGSVLYVGGTFDTINGQSRNYIAALNSTDGGLLSWDPNPDSYVYSIAISGTTVYIGGGFSMVGGVSHPYVAAVNASDGSVQSWDPQIVSPCNDQCVVKVVTVSGSTLYIGGDMNSAGGEARLGAAAFDIGTGLLTAWQPDAVGQVEAIVVSGSTVYIGGNISEVGGEVRTGVGAVDITTGIATSWDPQLNSGVLTMGLSGGALYMGGYFTSVGAEGRRYAAAVDASTAAVTAWDPSFDALVFSIAVSGSAAYIAGQFTNIQFKARNNSASFDGVSGVLRTWNPNFDGGVYAIDYSSATDTLFAGGLFSTVGGQGRNLAVELDVTTGAPTSWDPQLATDYNYDGGVKTLVVNGSTLYVGGDLYDSFSHVNIVAYNVMNGNPTAFLNDTVGQVNALSVANGKIYLGGYISEISGQTRNYIAAVDAESGAVDAWNPVHPATVYAISASVSSVVVGGAATSESFSRNGLAAYNPTTDTITNWNPHANGTTTTMTLSGSTLYVAGSFSLIGGQSRFALAGLDTTTASGTSWNPNPNTSGITALAVSGSTIYAAGPFSTMGGSGHPWIAALDAANGTASNWNPNPNTSGNITSISALAVSGSTLFVGGQFGHIGDKDRNHLAALDTSTGVASNWNPQMNSSGVSALAVSGSSLFVGGNYTAIGGQSRNNVAELSTSTANATNWNPNVNSVVNTLTLAGSTLYVGGSFSSVGGQTRNALAAVDVTTGIPSSWNPNVNGPVNTLTQTDSGLFAGGSFTAVGGRSASNMALFDQSPLPSIGFTATSSSGDESVSSVSLDVLLSESAATDVTVGYRVSGGSATGSGSDFTLATGTVTMLAGNTTGSIPLSIVNDVRHENTETVIISLFDVTENATIGSNASYTYSILDNDPQITHTVTYVAGANGTVTGTASQVINDGENGTPVTAVPNSGYHFVSWSDGSTSNPRTDTNVTSTISVTASFAADPVPVVTAPVGQGYLKLTVTAPKTLKPGATGTYGITIQNTGTAATSAITITYAVPKNTSLVTRASGGAGSRNWACKPHTKAGASCTITVPALGVQETVKLNIKVKVNTFVTGLAPKVGLRVVATSGGLRASWLSTVTITRAHTVRRGETLPSLSRVYYGTTKFWTNIRTANRSLFKQFTKFPNAIRIGWKLLIP